MKVKSKHGEIEGNHKEIKDFCKSVDFDPSLFFQPKLAPSILWIVGSLFIYFCMAIWLIISPSVNPHFITLATLFSLLLMVPIVVVTHLKCDNLWVSGFVAFIFLISIPIVMGWASPEGTVTKLTDAYKSSQEKKQ